MSDRVPQSIIDNWGKREVATTPERPDWRTYWLSIASAVAARADCSRRKVGAIVVANGRLRGGGYNGSPAGGPSCLKGECPRGLLSNEELPPDSSYDSGPGFCVAAHAEMNAIADTGRDVCLGATLYITDAPCPGCRRLIAISGIALVVWPHGSWIVANNVTEPVRFEQPPSHT